MGRQLMALSELLIGALLILSLFTGAAVGRGLNLVWYRSDTRLADLRCRGRLDMMMAG
jgi:hypothetical protein